MGKRTPCWRREAKPGSAVAGKLSSREGEVWTVDMVVVLGAFVSWSVIDWFQVNISNS